MEIKATDGKYSELSPSENAMSTDGQADCASIIVLWGLANRLYAKVRGQHALGGDKYDSTIWKDVPNTSETVVVVVPGEATTSEYGRQLDLGNVKRQAGRHGKGNATFLLAPSGRGWAIDRKGFLLVRSFSKGRDVARPFVAVPSNAGPSSPGRSNPTRDGSGKRLTGHH